MKRFFCLLTVAYCCGIAAAQVFGLEFARVYLTFIATTVLAGIFINENPFSGLLMLFAAFLLGASCLLNFDIIPGDHLANYVDYGASTCFIKGRIIDEPLAKNGRQIFVIESEWADFNKRKINCCGKVMVSSKQLLDLSCADTIIMKGHLRKVCNKGGRMPGYSNYLRNQGIYLTCNISSGIGCVKTDKKPGMIGCVLDLRKAIKGKIKKYHSPLAAGILSAMLLGQRQDIPQAIIDSMVRSGTVHILVVSGFNVGIVFYIVLIMLKLARIPRFPRLVAAVLFLSLYCFLTGASTPVVRATIMAAVFICASFVKRDADIYNSLAIAALFILVFNPRQAFDIGFQLSFVSVLSIVYLYPKIKPLRQKLHLKSMPVVICFDAFLVSLSAWAGTSGLIAYHFKIFSPVTVFANILIVPLASLVTLCGFSFIMISPVFPQAAALFASTAEFLAFLILKANFLFLKLPFAYFLLG